MKGCNLKSNKWNRRGSIVDSIPVMIYVFVFFILCVVSFVSYDGLVDAGFFTIMSTAGGNGITTNLTQFQNDADNAYDALDTIGIFVLLGTAISSMLGALLLRTHPAFFFISIVVMLMEVIVAMALANTSQVLLASSSMVSAQAQFPILGYIMLNFPVFIFVITLLIAVVLYAINPLGQ